MLTYACYIYGTQYELIFSFLLCGILSNIISDTHEDILCSLFTTHTPTDIITKVFFPALLLSSHEYKGLGKTIKDGSDNAGK